MQVLQRLAISCLPLLPPALGRTLALCILVAVVVLPLRVWPPRARFLELDAGRSRAFAVPLACATLAGILFL